MAAERVQLDPMTGRNHEQLGDALAELIEDMIERIPRSCQPFAKFDRTTCVTDPNDDELHRFAHSESVVRKAIASSRTIHICANVMYPE